MMEEVVMMEESVHVNGQTPCFTSVNTSGDHGSHDSIDSGYLSTLTPHTSGYMSTSYRTRSSSGLALSAKKQHRFRPDAPQRKKLQRHRSKLDQLSAGGLQADSAINENSMEDYRETSSLSLLEPASNASLAHSTPSCATPDAYGDTASFDGSGNWRTTVLITPAFVTNFRLMSPAVPSSSYVATEPVQEKDVEMKLVEKMPNKAAQHMRTPPRLRISIPRIMISPIRRRNSPIAITSADNRKLSELCITDLPIASEIKPKKLDFSQPFAVLRARDNATISSTSTCTTTTTTNQVVSTCGKEKIDFLSLLGEKSNHLNIVSRILALLEDEDLCTIVRVSTVWRKLCENDYVANKRRKRFLLRKQNIKENTRMLTRKSKHEEDIQTSPRSRYHVRKGCLIDVKNLLNVQEQRKPPSSPPVSPSKIKFHSFVKASRTLASGEYLLPCPMCRFPCHVDNERNIGRCSRQGCSIEFCISCSSKSHTGPCKTPLLATPTKCNSKRLIIGSRQSKRNLRRL